MRIIAGKHRGTNLLSPEGLDTRPTPQRVREAVFSMLESGRFGTVLRDRVVLDLFAGTGAMGLEALSRGAERVVLVDNHPTALDALRANVEKLRAGARAQVRSGDASRWHERAQVACGVVFMDPPYGSEAWVPALAAASKRKVSFDAEVSPAKAVAGLQGDDEHDDFSEAEEESVYSEEELSGLEEAEDEWWAQGGGGRGGGCVPVL